MKNQTKIAAAKNKQNAQGRRSNCSRDVAYGNRERCRAGRGAGSGVEHAHFKLLSHVKSARGGGGEAAGGGGCNNSGSSWEQSGSGAAREERRGEY